MPTPMMNPAIVSFVQGFLLCASTIVALGPQNVFILRQGLRQQHVFATAFFSTVADVVLITLAVGGLSAVIATNNLFRIGVSIAGAGFLLYTGGSALLRAARNGIAAPSLAAQLAGNSSIRATVITALCFAFLNPGAYVDTLMVIGSTSLNFAAADRPTFAIGAVLASTTWFFTLAYGASRLTPLLQSRLVWRALDVVSGLVMVGIASRLVVAMASQM